MITISVVYLSHISMAYSTGSLPFEEPQGFPKSFTSSCDSTDHRNDRLGFSHSLSSRNSEVDWNPTWLWLVGWSVKFLQDWTGSLSLIQRLNMKMLGALNDYNILRISLWKTIKNTYCLWQQVRILPATQKKKSIETVLTLYLLVCLHVTFMPAKKYQFMAVVKPVFQTKFNNFNCNFANLKK